MPQGVEHGGNQKDLTYLLAGDNQGCRKALSTYCPLSLGELVEMGDNQGCRKALSTLTRLRRLSNYLSEIISDAARRGAQPEPQLVAVVAAREIISDAARRGALLDLVGRVAIMWGDNQGCRKALSTRILAISCVGHLLGDNQGCRKALSTGFGSNGESNPRVR